MKLSVFDARGRKVAELADRYHAAGTHRVEWAGRDDRGRLVPSGVYVYRLEAGRRVMDRRLTVVR